MANLNINRSVLLIDDDVIFNLITKKLFRKAGYSNPITIVNNGEEALDYVKNILNSDKSNLSSKPKLILLDINMPVMGGFEFLKAFAEFPKNQTKNICVVMLTSSLSKMDLEKAENSPFISDIISKPLNLEKTKILLDKYF